MGTLRYFPPQSSPRKNCYVVPVEGDTQYLVRAWFMFGNFIDEPESGFISFGLSLDAAHWRNVYINTSAYPTSRFYEEAIVWATKPSVSICLIRLVGTPFINSLELRAMRPTSYLGRYGLASRSSKILALDGRMNYGAEQGNWIRFPDDDYDRLWQPCCEDDPYLVPVVAPYQDMVYDDSTQADYVCNAVMQTAVTGRGGFGENWHLRTPLLSSTMYVHLIFAELEVLPAGESRIVVVQTNFMEERYQALDSYDLELSRPYQVYEYGSEYANVTFECPGCVDNAISWRLLPRGPSKDPLLNAFEAYSVIDLPDGTSTQDVNALTSINLAIGFHQWVGDPCFPVSWDELKCTGNRVTALNLTGKGLTGLIPADISKLTSLTSLDLSDNSFTGPLPTWVADLPLQTLDVSNNRLSGTFPATYITKISTFRYFGNLQLSCQASGHATCPPPPPPPRASPSSPGAPSNLKSQTSIAPIIGGIVGGIVVILVIGAFLMFFCRWKPAAKIEIPPSTLQNVGLVNADTIPYPGGRGKAQPFTLQAVREATKDFTEQIGEGGFGRVYLGVLPGKQPVAVKVMSGKSQQGFPEILNEIDLLSAIHHRNLVSLVGYCEEGDYSEEGLRLILLYEFMSGGDLRNWLYGGEEVRRSPLNWRQRLQIALDAAKGLEYLHHGCNPAIFHRDVKSSNILLNDNLDAKVADFGLSKLSENGQTHVTTMLKGTLGYLDPEYHTTGKLTDKSDVYSFGVVLLEILCGHPPITEDAAGSKFIVEKVRAAVNTGTLVAVVDPALGGHFTQEAVWRYADIAMSCVPVSAATGPTMGKVVAELAQTLEMELGSGTNLSSDMTRQIETGPHPVDQPSQIFHSREGPQAW